MNRTPQKSSSGLKKNYAVSTSSLSKSKVQLPSRYNQGSKNQKSGLHKILNSIEGKVRLETLENPTSPQSKPKPLFNDHIISTKINKKNSQFKSQPLKRQQSDRLQFNQIFLNPRQEALSSIQKTFSQQNSKTITKQYQKLLRFQQGQTITEENQKQNNSNTKQNYQQAIQLLQSQDFTDGPGKKKDENFYDNQISIETPILTNTSTIISGLKINAPSLPPNYNNNKDLNIKQLLLRAKAGMNSQDIEKQAHLSFLLGEVYLQRKKYRGALKFYKKYLGFARIMEDRTGMCLGANRVGISHYNCGDFQKSIAFHNQNMKLSGNDHCFFGLYNIGICYRKLNQPQAALQYFQSALNWSQQKGEEDSQCLSLGQIGSTYQVMQLFQEAVEKFEQSLQICNKIKKKGLKLINLRNILKVSSKFKMKSMDQLEKIALQSFQCAKQIGETSLLDIFRSNIGILKGIQQFASNQPNLQQLQQIQQIQ